MPDETVRKIGQYELRKPLGRGGMATVWRAYQPSLDRDVAIKLMAAQFTEDENFTKRFNQEARSIARLRHPNILAVYEYGQDNGQPYIVTELLDGGTLREFMQKPLDLRQISRIISQVADALDYAHAQGMVHRDIKPTNILMGTQRVLGDRAVLADFGIVKLLANTNLTQTGVGVGTPEYMSPEQAAGEPLDGRSDEYALGIVLYELLTGVTPYKSDTPLAVLMGHVNRPLPDPRQFNPQLSESIVAVLTQALAKYPQGRYGSAGEFADAFAQAVAATMPAGSQTEGVSGPQRLTPGQAPKVTQAQTSLSQSGRASTDPGFVPTAVAYDHALRQERLGNRQAAYETLVDIQRRDPNYQDVPDRLRDYEGQHFHYTGQHTLFQPPRPPENNAAPENNSPTRVLPVGPYKSPTVSGPYVPNDPTGSSPAPAAPPTSANGNIAPPSLPQNPAPVGSFAVAPPASAPARPGLGRILLLGIGTALLVGVVVAAVILIAGGGSKSDPTSTGVAAPVTVTGAANGTSAPPQTTTGPATTTAAVPTTAPAPTTLAPTIPAEKPDPAGVTARQISTGIYTSSGNLKDGIDRLKTLAKANPTSWVTQRELGRANYWYGREKSGLDYLKEAVRLNPDDPMSHAYLAVAYFDAFDDVNALAAVNKAVQLNPNSADVRAAQSLTLLRNDLKGSRENAQAALKIDQDNLLANWAGWSSFAYSNEFPTAQSYIEKLTKAYPNIANFIAARGYQYILENNIPEGEKKYREALKVDPDYPAAHTGLGEIYRLRGQNNEAITEYRLALKVNDSDVNAHVGLGYSLDAIGDSKAAEDQFRAALQLDVRNASAYNGLAISYITRATLPANTQIAPNYLNLAIENTDQALKLSPNYPDANFQKGRALVLLKRFSEAEAPLKKAIDLDRENSTYHYVLAYSYASQKNYDDAKKEVAEALRLKPDYAEAQQLSDQLKKV